ncbi:MAG: hypothetical protein E7127_06070 [Rikenellaceae bacterium]|nr:hypothetical protein [Rikenellaceae bacterium]
MDNMERNNQQNKMIQQALGRMNKESLSPDFKARLMAQIRQREYNREMWIGVGLATMFIVFVCLMVYLAYRIYLSMGWTKIFTPENVYQLKLWTMIFISAPLLFIFDKYASPKILAFFDKIDPRK